MKKFKMPTVKVSLENDKTDIYMPLAFIFLGLVISITIVLLVTV